jgi:cytochrome b561
MRTSLVLGVLSLVLSVSAEQAQVPLSASSKSSHKAAKRREWLMTHLYLGILVRGLELMRVAYSSQGEVPTCD